MRETKKIIDVLKFAWIGLKKDLDVLERVGGSGFRRRPRPVALILEPGLRAAFWMRLASRSKVRTLAIFARTVLINRYSCDIAQGARIHGGIYLPHPLGIVIGAGVVVHDGVRIFQNVTLGSGRAAGYPTIREDAIIYPGSAVVGRITVGRGSRVSALSYLDHDLSPFETHRRNAVSKRDSPFETDRIT